MGVPSVRFRVAWLLLVVVLGGLPAEGAGAHDPPTARGPAASGIDVGVADAGRGGGPTPASTLTLGLQADRSQAERGDVVSATLSYQKQGPTVETVWLNWSLGGHYDLVDLAPALPRSPTPEGFSIRIADLASGPQAVTARLRVVRGMSDGMHMPVVVSATVASGGVASPAGTVEAVVTLLAPSLTVDLRPAGERVLVSERFPLHVTVPNAGRAGASAWLNLSLPSGLDYLGDNGTFPVSTRARVVSWTLGAVPAGTTIALAVEVVIKSPRVVSLRAELAYTDGKGSPAASAQSPSATVEAVTSLDPGPGEVIAGSAWWLIPLALGASLAAAVVLARTRGRVEEVFLVTHGGVLLVHLFRTARASKDRELVGAMLTAVQNFVQDVFAAGREGELQRMDFGQEKILIQRGQRSYLACVVAGRWTAKNTADMRNALRAVETAMAGAPANWSEDEARVQAAGRLLRDGLL